MDKKNQNMDWSGNKKSTYVTLGASNHVEHERAEHDYYSTDPIALEKFLDRSKEDFTINKNIWECACGNGVLSEILLKQGYNVLSSDLVDRGYSKYSEIDFLQQTSIFDGDILTNPPYKYANDFVKHALELVPEGNHVIMFLKIQFLESKERYEFFKENPPKFIYVHSTRVNCYLNGTVPEKPASSAVCYAWFVWEKDYKGDPVIKWIA